MFYVVKVMFIETWKQKNNNNNWIELVFFFGGLSGWINSYAFNVHYAGAVWIRPPTCRINQKIEKYVIKCHK
jgi:hypothetical protein